MKYEGVIVTVSRHAHEQYCARIGPIEWDELIRQTQALLDADERGYDDGVYMQLGGIWWAVARVDMGLIMKTCYGRTSMHLPRALKWARRHNDRISLESMAF
ncbi:hypothetical protein HGI30_16790 [Paenibacillus albicereus]|uniref:Uncharacterized protein n=1 Tax=Paenibacillus albicereus TaxID=2726185 RepID=A0A6H2H0X2_9BACL|nr:hypothetical protein [Paenibacillus albicereus]QJC53066.1 hypothetical protein HGI30_16790 [Paenibacillus albicereus]